LLAVLMDFCSGSPLQFLSGVDTLHTTLIDSRNGYEEALADAEGKGLTPLFREMIARHDADIPRIAAILRQEGEQPDSSGSFMSTVHRTVISIRSMITRLDESILPSLISGEERVLRRMELGKA
jgi:uncharacterized protein (TIGR02284 family)